MCMYISNSCPRWNYILRKIQTCISWAGLVLLCRETVLCLLTRKEHPYGSKTMASGFWYKNPQHFIFSFHRRLLLTLPNSADTLHSEVISHVLCLIQKNPYVVSSRVFSLFYSKRYTHLKIKQQPKSTTTTTTNPTKPSKPKNGIEFNDCAFPIKGSKNPGE